MSRSVIYPFRELQIVCAALRSRDGVLVCAPRHHQCYALAGESAVWRDPEGHEQGFVDQDLNFYTRAEACELRAPGSESGSLISEELY